MWEREIYIWSITIIEHSLFINIANCIISEWFKKYFPKIANIKQCYVIILIFSFKN